jgi:hypothetical protein
MVTWRTVLRGAAVLLFIICALSSFADGVNVIETGFGFVGLACFAASFWGPTDRVVR